MRDIIIVILLCFIPAYLAKQKNRKFWGFFLLSCLISPLFATIMVLCLPKRVPASETSEVPNPEASEGDVEFEVLDSEFEPVAEFIDADAEPEEVEFEVVSDPITESDETQISEENVVE